MQFHVWLMEKFATKLLHDNKFHRWLNKIFVYLNLSLSEAGFNLKLKFYICELKYIN